MKTLQAIKIALAVLVVTPCALAGPYSAAWQDASNAYDPGIPGFVGPDGDGYVTANNVVNPAFVEWATEVVDYSPAPAVDPQWQYTDQVLGEVTGDYQHIASLGDLSQTQIDSGVAPGSITLGFHNPIRDAAGADFAVFENAYMVGSLTFGELAYAEVSTDGVNFARFDSTSLTSSAVGAYGNIDATDVHNLAGKHLNHGGYSWGTPFDLSSLAGDPLVTAGDVSLGEINYVRLVDVPGSGDYLDAQGDPIYDAWVTTGSGGFDLEAVGVLNANVAGDADCDGDVDLSDFNVVRYNWGDGDTWQTGDFDGNGTVGLSDFNAVRYNWGSAGAPTDESLATSQPVPEPATLTLLALGAACVIRRRGAGR